MSDTGVSYGLINLPEGCNSLKDIYFSGNPYRDRTYGKFYACGIGKFAYKSTDMGQTWSSEQVSSSNKDFTGIAADQRCVLAINNSNSAVSYVSSSSSYISKVISSSVKNWKGVAQGNNAVVALADDGYITYTTNFGSSWYNKNLSSLQGNTNTHWNSIKFINSTFVALGGATNDTDLSLAYSINGYDWYIVSIAGNQYASDYVDIVFDGNNYLMISWSASSNKTILAISQSLSTGWIQTTISNISGAKSIGFYSASTTSFISTSNKAYSSYNLLTWTEVPNIGGISKFASGKINNTETLLGLPVATDSSYVYIYNGTWGQSATSAIRTWKEVKYVNNAFFITGQMDDGVYQYTGSVWSHTSVSDSTKVFIGLAVNSSNKFIMLPYQSNDAIVFSQTSSEYDCTIISKSLEDKWMSIAYGDGIYVAISNTKFICSTNGTKWNGCATPYGHKWSKVAYGNGRFVAFTESTTYIAIGIKNGSSVDWRISSNRLPGYGWTKLKFLNGKFVAIKTGSQMITSSDGEIWSTKIISSYSRQWSDITYGSGRYIICAKSSSSVATSTNLDSWTELSTGLNALAWSVIKAFRGSFAMFTPGSSVYGYSSDGFNWSSKTLPISLSWVCCESSNDIAVLFANSSASALTTTDLLNWVTVSLNTTLNITTSAVIYGYSDFIIVTQTENKYVKYTHGNVAYIKYRGIPCIKRSILSSDSAINRKMRTVMNDISSSIDKTKDKLANNFKVSMKFFNTTGSSSYFYVSDISGKQTKPIDNLELSLDLTIGMKSGYVNFNSSIMNDIKQSIKIAIENGMNDNKIFIDTILNDVKEKYNDYISFLIFGQLNNFDQIYRVINYTPPEDVSDDVSEFIYLPISNISIHT